MKPTIEPLCPCRLRLLCNNDATRLREKRAAQRAAQQELLRAGRSLAGPSASTKEYQDAVATYTKDGMKTSSDVQIARGKNGQITSIVDAETGEPVPYLQRLIDGQCPKCGQGHGHGPNERYLLPRVGRGDSWDFVAPCGHAVLGIKKDSPLAEEYGLTEDVGVLSRVEQDLLKTALVCEQKYVKAEHVVPAAKLISRGLVTARDSYDGVQISPTKAGQGLARGLGLHVYRSDSPGDPGWFHYHPDRKERAT